MEGSATNGAEAEHQQQQQHPSVQTQWYFLLAG
jgi:hypothetical protein